MILPRDVWNDAPPSPRTPLDNNPTLLFSWWCTGFALVIILIRLAGRKIRTDCLFAEDKVMFLSIIPLLARMGLIHVVLRWGTNNVTTDGRDLSSSEIYHRSMGSKLVLASRIMYAMFIWMAKFTVSEFLKRIFNRFWRRGYEYTLRGIRVFLIVTFCAVVIATLAECQPFDHYWQVTPDPGPKCRQGYAHLITMGVSDIITDILLITFPIPVIVKSHITFKRKIQLILLFGMSIILIGITAARVPLVIIRLGLQQYRSVFASAEILAAAAISNAVILGSFLRDKGVKKTKRYKFGSTSDSMDRAQQSRRGTITTQQWGSDEDLVRDMGYRLHPSLVSESDVVARPAPVATPHTAAPKKTDSPFAGKPWQFPNGNPNGDNDSDVSDIKVPVAQDPNPSPGQVEVIPPRRLSFFDVGGLLEDGSMRSSTLVPSPVSTVSAQDFAGPRRGSRALLTDLGGLLGQRNARRSAPEDNPRESMEDRELESLSSAPIHRPQPASPVPEPSSSSDLARFLREESPPSPNALRVPAHRPSRSSSQSPGPAAPNFSRPRSTQRAPQPVPPPADGHADTSRHSTFQDVGGLLG